MNRLEWYSAWQQARKIKDYDLLANEILHGTDQNLKIGLMLLSERDVQTIETSPKVCERAIKEGYDSLNHMLNHYVFIKSLTKDELNQIKIDQEVLKWINT